LRIDGKINRDELVNSFCRLVAAERRLYDYALSYPIRHPLTKGHRYFLVHFCDHPDGYIHMANFMATAERSAQKEKDNLFLREDELPFIAEELEKAVSKTNVKKISDTLPSILSALRRNSSTCQARHVFKTIVERFQWWRPGWRRDVLPHAYLLDDLWLGMGLAVTESKTDFPRCAGPASI
jgi:hypothetical protein